MLLEDAQCLHEQGKLVCTENLIRVGARENHLSSERGDRCVYQSLIPVSARQNHLPSKRDDRPDVFLP